MKIEKFNEKKEEKYSKHYVFAIHRGSRTYRGSIWDTNNKPWVPDDATLIGEFDTGDRDYMIVTQAELDEINELKAEYKSKEDAKKFNL